MAEEKRKTNEGYKPSKREVFEELGNIVKTNYDSAKNRLRDFGKAFLAGGLATQLIYHVFPSVIRYTTENERNYHSNGAGPNFNEIIGFASGISSGAIFTSEFHTLILESMGHEGLTPDLCLFGATNLASGAYEFGRGLYKKAENKVVEERKSQLEKIELPYSCETEHKIRSLKEAGFGNLEDACQGIEKKLQNAEHSRGSKCISIQKDKDPYRT